jgi:hypothetical protein
MRRYQLLRLLGGLLLAAGGSTGHQGGPTGPNPDAKPTPDQAVARVRRVVKVALRLK